MDITTAFPNPDVEIEGVWCDYRDDSKVKIARIGNPRFLKIYERKMKPYRRRSRNNEVPYDIEMKCSAEAVAEAVLLDWKGFTEGPKKVLEYSKENAVKLLLSHIDFRNEVTALADLEETFKEIDDQDAEKN